MHNPHEFNADKSHTTFQQNKDCNGTVRRKIEQSAKSHTTFQQNKDCNLILILIILVVVSIVAYDLPAKQGLQP